MEDHDLPRLATGIEIVDQPIAQNGRIVGESLGRLGVERGAVQLTVEEMRIGVQKDEVGVAGIERIVVHVVDLLLGAFSGINRSGSAVGSDRGGGSVRLPFETEEHPVGGDSVGVPGELGIDTSRPIERKIVVVKVGQRVAAVGVAGETPCAVATQHVGIHAGGTDVVIADDDVKGNAANEGSAGLVRINVAVPDGKPEVAIAAFGAVGVDVVAGVKSEVWLREMGNARDFEMVNVVHQVGDAGLEVGEPQRI